MKGLKSKAGLFTEKAAVLFWIAMCPLVVGISRLKQKIMKPETEDGYSRE